MGNDGYMKSEEDLICGYLKNELTGEETSRLIRWLEQDKKNKRLFDEMSDLWATVRALQQIPASMPGKASANSGGELTP